MINAQGYQLWLWIFIGLTGFGVGMISTGFLAGVYSVILLSVFDFAPGGQFLMAFVLLFIFRVRRQIN